MDRFLAIIGGLANSSICVYTGNSIQCHRTNDIPTYKELRIFLDIIRTVINLEKTVFSGVIFIKTLLFKRSSCTIDKRQS